MSVDGLQVVAEARRWLDTPFIHQARLRGVGVDCAGLVVAVARELGIGEYDVAGYARAPQGNALREALNAALVPVAFRDAAPGDVLCFRMDQDPQHLAILTRTERAGSMIHAYAHPLVRRVVEHGMGTFWKDRLAGCYRFPGVG